MTLGNLHAPGAALALFGLAVTAALAAWRMRGAILIGIVATSLAGWGLGLVAFKPQPYDLAALSQTAFHLDLAGVLGLSGSHGLGLFEILFVFLFVDLFDNIGTLVGVTTAIILSVIVVYEIGAASNPIGGAQLDPVRHPGVLHF